LGGVPVLIGSVVAPTAAWLQLTLEHAHVPGVSGCVLGDFFELWL